MAWRIAPSRSGACWEQLFAFLTPPGRESWNGKLGLEAFVENKGVLRHVSGELAASRLVSTPCPAPVELLPSTIAKQHTSLKFAK
jgi:hypothetical protein